MKNKILAYKEHLKNPNLIALVIAILTTGFLRSQTIIYPPASDSGLYTFASQWIFNAIAQDIVIKDTPLYLYQFMTAWVYGLDVNPIILLRVIDCFVAIAASIVLFNVILKESGSKVFTVILMTSLLIILHNGSYVIYGFRNSVWAAYLPLFTALLVWQNSAKGDKYSFYVIGALISLGVLLREVFLPLYFLALIAIYISYGWLSLGKYLIGSALLGFSVLCILLMFRGWDLNNLIDSYLLIGATYEYKGQGLTFTAGILHLIQTGWFVFVLSLVSILYFIKLKFNNKKSVNMNRIYLWFLLLSLPLIEPILKPGYYYHYSNSFIGLAGLAAMGWKYLSLQESKQINKLAILLIGLMSLFIIIPTVNNENLKNKFISPSTIINSVKRYDSLRSPQFVGSDQYMAIAAKIYSLSREDSTLVTSGLMQVLYPLTDLLPPTYELSRLRNLYVKLNFDENKLIKIIKKHRPTLIVTTDWIPGEAKMSAIIDKIDLYEKVAIVPSNSTKNYGHKSGTIYRLKNF